MTSTTIYINSKVLIDNNNSVKDANRLYELYLEIPPININNNSILKVVGFTHTDGGTATDTKIYQFKIKYLMYNNSKYISFDNSPFPTIMATNLTNNKRNISENYNIPLTKQTINNLSILVSDDPININAGIPLTINFIMILKIEDE